eukprot:jgi/Ulvmu1/11243/UM073_0015.1
MALAALSMLHAAQLQEQKPSCMTQAVNRHLGAILVSLTALAVCRVQSMTVAAPHALMTMAHIDVSCVTCMNRGCRGLFLDQTAVNVIAVLLACASHVSSAAHAESSPVSADPNCVPGELSKLYNRPVVNVVLTQAFRTPASDIKAKPQTTKRSSIAPNPTGCQPRVCMITTQYP